MEYDFIIKGFAGPRHPHARSGELLLETIHRGTVSAQIEMDAWKERMRRGEVSHAELIDIRTGGGLTNLRVYVETKIDWDKPLEDYRH